MSFIFFLIVLILITVFIIFIWQQNKNTQLIETVTSSFRGESSERDVVLKLVKMDINPKAIFHDCYIQKADGTYTQVDIVVATNRGLVVFEVKDFSGWIFGNFHQKYWTQILAYGKQRHRFYNPIMQNDAHIKAIRESLCLNPDIPIFSVIVFYGSCTLKNITKASDNDFIIYPHEMKNTMKEIFSRPLAKFGDKHEIMNVLTQAVNNGNDPGIVASQLTTASIASKNKPRSTYYYS